MERMICFLILSFNKEIDKNFQLYFWFLCIFSTLYHLRSSILTFKQTYLSFLQAQVCDRPPTCLVYTHICIGAEKFWKEAFTGVFETDLLGVVRMETQQHSVFFYVWLVAERAWHSAVKACQTTGVKSTGFESHSEALDLNIQHPDSRDRT